MPARPKTMNDIVDLIERGPDRGPIRIGDLIARLGEASFTPLLLIPALALVSPLSGIPFFTTVMGFWIFLVSLQMLMQRDHIWLPRWLLNLETDAARVDRAVSWVRPVVAWVDRRTTPYRLAILTRKPLVFFPQLLCVLCGLFLPLLEFIPFSSLIVGVAVTLLGIGILARDGFILFVATLPFVALGVVIARLI